MSVLVCTARSAADRLAAWRVRERVFVGEQGIPESLERDGLDDVACHLLARRDGVTVGTARVFGLGRDRHAVPLAQARVAKIGRMAVLPEQRRLGIGRRLLEAALDVCRRQGIERVELSAQEAVVSFYERAGFQCEGAGYLEAGIPHRFMGRLVEAGTRTP